MHVLRLSSLIWQNIYVDGGTVGSLCACIHGESYAEIELLNGAGLREKLHRRAVSPSEMRINATCNNKLADTRRNHAELVCRLLKQCG